MTDKEDESNNLIAQAARDYDMSLNRVKWLFSHYKDNFYEKLEDELKDRRRTN